MEAAAVEMKAKEQLIEHRSRVAAMALCMCGEKSMNQAIEEFLIERAKGGTA